MDTKSMTRKEFVTLTFTLIGSAAAACSSSSSSNDGGTGGSTGSGGNGSGGTAAAAAAAGTAAAAPNGSGACTNPLPETQVADTTGHTHTVTIPASDLDATTDQMIDTSDPVTGTSSPTCTR